MDSEYDDNRGAFRPTIPAKVFLLRRREISHSGEYRGDPLDLDLTAEGFVATMVEDYRLGQQERWR